MTAIDLPTQPSTAEISWRLVDYGASITSPLGGPDLRVNRLGARWQVSITTPPMDVISSHLWRVALSRAVLVSAARWNIVQPGLCVGTPGVCVAAGVGQLGDSLDVRVSSPGYVFQPGQMISVLVNQSRYVHMVGERTGVDEFGRARIPVIPNLRVAVPDQAVVEVAHPKIEGRVEAEASGWTAGLDAFAPIQLTLIERA